MSNKTESAASNPDISQRAHEAALRSSISKCLASDNYEDNVALGEALWKLCVRWMAPPTMHAHSFPCRLTAEQQDELVADWGIYDNDNDAEITMSEYREAEIKWSGLGLSVIRNRGVAVG